MEKYVGKMILIYKYLIFFQRKCVILQGGHTKRESILAILTLFDGLKQLFFIHRDSLFLFTFLLLALNCFFEFKIIIFIINTSSV